MKKLLAIVLCLMMALNLVACGGGSASSSASGKNVIKIGVFEPQTGENGGGGLQEVFGIRYANSIYKTIIICNNLHNISP